MESAQLWWSHFFSWDNSVFAAFRSFGFSCGGDGGEQSVAGEEENDGQTGQNLQRDEHVQTRPIEIHQHEHRAQGQVEQRHVQGAGGEKVNKIIRIKIIKLTKQKRGRRENKRRQRRNTRGKWKVQKDDGEDKIKKKRKKRRKKEKKKKEKNKEKNKRKNKKKKRKKGRYIGKEAEKRRKAEIEGQKLRSDVDQYKAAMFFQVQIDVFADFF